MWPWRTRDKTPIELCGDTLDTYRCSAQLRAANDPSVFTITEKALTIIVRDGRL